MKTILLAAAVALTLGVGVAYADGNGGDSAGTARNIPHQYAARTVPTGQQVMLAYVPPSEGVA